MPQHVDQAIGMNSRYVDVLINRGYCYHSKKLYKNALQDYDKAIELAKTSGMIPGLLHPSLAADDTRPLNTRCLLGIRSKW